MIRRAAACLLACILLHGGARGQGSIPSFPLEPSGITLTRAAQPRTYFDKAGRKFAVLGYESGIFEAWAWPLKLFRNAELSFLLGSSTQPIPGRDLVRSISVTPVSTTLRYTYQSFTIDAHFITPIDEPGAYILLDVRSTEPLTIVCSFLPVLQPMWPAGIGGQSAFWYEKIKAYRISEPTRQNSAFIGSPAAEGISYTPAHMLSDTPNEFRIVISDPSSVAGRFIPIVMAGGHGNRDSLQAVYVRLAGEAPQQYQKTVRHYDRLMRSSLQIHTPIPEIDRAFELAKVSFDNLFVDNPDVGLGMVAGLGTSGTGGRPGFGWFFGGDAYINSLSLNAFGAPNLTRDALAFTRQWQRDDGKMAHELTQAAAYVHWWKDYPYGYIHGDTSPYYICAMWDYFQTTADTAFLRESWESLKKAYAWSRATDGDGDGLMDNKKAGLGALEYGPLTDIQSDIYTGAVWARAASVMPALARAAGDAETAADAAAYADRTNDAFDGRFWDEKHRRYAYAFTRGGDHVDIVSPWAAVGLMWGLGTPEHSRSTLAEFNSAELSTDWGIRSISEKSAYYEPLNYNYGAVWPFLTSWVAAAQFRHSMSVQAYNTLLACVNHTYDNALGHLTEVFSGAANIWPGEAVAHQGFSSASVVLPLVRGLLGVAVDAPSGSLAFAPQFPADWTNASVSNIAVGGSTVDLRYIRSSGAVQVECVVRGDKAVTFTWRPVFGAGTRITAAAVNDRPVQFTTSMTPQTIQAVTTTTLRAGTTRIRYTISPAVEILPPPLLSKTGDRNLSLKIVDVSRNDDVLRLEVEGRAGGTYALGMTNAGMVRSVDGATVAGDTLSITFPAGGKDDFVRRTVRVLCAEPSN